ncbi:unnamed protein product [Ambrosiozyma monospora]|uniref:Unnamed protein product n=1 Tax=Ambrosiozyma monospora TaxID=43982 RepID=A0ACB5TAB5_AMBMO|nr:unnamed protein product [Ambrosiozyma monospora]
MSITTPAGPTTITFSASSTVITSCYTDSNGQVITKTVTEPCPISTTTSTPASNPKKTTSQSSKLVETTTTTPKEESTTTAPKAESSSATTIATVSTGVASTQPSITLAEGAAADFKPQGALAFAAGLVAALLI